MIKDRDREPGTGPGTWTRQGDTDQDTRLQNRDMEREHEGEPATRMALREHTGYPRRPHEEFRALYWRCSREANTHDAPIGSNLNPGRQAALNWGERWTAIQPTRGEHADITETRLHTVLKRAPSPTNHSRHQPRERLITRHQ